MKKNRLIVLVGREGSGHELIAEKCRAEYGFAACLSEKEHTRKICTAAPGRACRLKARGGALLVFIAASLDRREEREILRKRTSAPLCEQEGIEDVRQCADYIFSCGGSREAEEICRALVFLAEEKI